MQGFRFVVAFRPETSGARDSAPVWRGWVEQVFPTSDDGGFRKAFNELSEVSPLIETAVDSYRAEGKDAD